MSQFVETPTKTFQANAAISQHLRVKLSSSKLVLAGATDHEIGTMNIDANAANERVAVRLLTAQGTVKMVANEAISADSVVYSGASGKVSDSDTGGAHRIGIAIDASTADGDVIEVLRDAVQQFRGLDDFEETLTASAPAASPFGVSLIDSASNAVAATLASGSVIGQMKYFNMIDSSNGSTVTITLHETSDPEVATFNAIDEALLLVWNGTEWHTISANGATFV